MSSDSLACFQSLLQSIPGWIADLESIVHNANQKQESLRAELMQLTKESKRSPSLEAHQAKRRRKSASECSRIDAEPRNEAVTVDVVFDGDTQKAFENLVRSVGASRNQIRKSKLSARLCNLSRSDSSSSSAGEETIKGLGTFTYRTTTTLHRGETGSEVFDTVDGALERAQADCEKAAHQLLRGVCKTGGAKANFEAAFNAVQAALPVMARRAAREEAAVAEKPASSIGCESLSSEATLEVDPNEPDTDDSEDEFIPMKIEVSKFRLTRSPVAPAIAIH